MEPAYLKRAIKRKDGGGFYFNSGTWIRLIRFTDAMLADSQSFQPVYQVLSNGSMSAIDSAVIGGQPVPVEEFVRT